MDRNVRPLRDTSLMAALVRYIRAAVWPALVERSSPLSIIPVTAPLISRLWASLALEPLPNTMTSGSLNGYTPLSHQPYDTEFMVYSVSPMREVCASHAIRRLCAY